MHHEHIALPGQHPEAGRSLVAQDFLSENIFGDAYDRQVFWLPHQVLLGRETRAL